MPKKKYFSKCSLETLSQAVSWGIFDSEKEAIRSGYEGCKNGLGNSFRIVEVITTYRLRHKVFKAKKRLTAE